MEGFPKLMAVLFVLPDPSLVLPWLQSPKNKIHIQPMATARRHHSPRPLLCWCVPCDVGSSVIHSTGMRKELCELSGQVQAFRGSTLKAAPQAWTSPAGFIYPGKLDGSPRSVCRHQDCMSSIEHFRLMRLQLTSLTINAL